MLSMKVVLKIAIFAQLLPGSAGGIETNLLELLRNLQRVDAALRTVAIGPGDSSAWLRDQAPQTEVLPWTVIRYQVEDSVGACQRAALPKRLAIMLRRARVRRSAAFARQGHHVASGRELSSALRAKQVELVHFPYQRYFETDLPFIFEPWDLQHLHYPENFSEKEVRFREHLYREACQRARLVVVPTRWGKRDLASKFGVDEGKIAVIGRGPGNLSAQSVQPSDQALPPRYVAYPAKFWPHKNHLRLFEALKQLRSRGCTVPLVCTGEPVSAMPEALRRSISRHGLENQITFLGHLERQALTAMLKRAEILAFPSLFEGYGIPVLEAMSLGVPVVCSRIGPLDEIAGGAAEQFDPKDPLDIARSLEAVWLNRDRRNELAELGRRRAQDFRWLQAARDFIVCYKKVAGRPLSLEEGARLASLISSK
jgi:glycosyltransferase involved in cell wall biosynthesis